MDVLASRWDRGDAVMFVGAGISKRQPARAPIWNEMQRDFTEALYARLVAMQWPTDLLDDAEMLTRHRFRPEAFWDVVQRVASLDCVEAAFRVLSVGSPNLNHRTLARLLGDERLDAVITTNFDEHIEAAVLSETRPVTMTYTGPDPSAFGGDAYLLKLHGTLSLPDTLRFTLAHYDALAEPMAEALKDTIAGRHLVIAGYSGWDEDILPVLADAVSMSASTLVIVYPGSPRDEPVRSLADHGAEFLDADVNALVQAFAEADAAARDETSGGSTEAGPPVEDLYRQAVETLPLVINSLVIAHLHELAGDYGRMYSHGLLAGDIIESGYADSQPYGEQVRACLDTAAAKAGRGDGLGSFYHRHLVGMSGHIETFHDAVRKAEGIARQTTPVTREQRDWIEEFAADLPWREEQSGAQLPQPERAHAFWAVARYRVAQGQPDEGLAIFRDVGEPDPAVVGHLAATDAYLAAAAAAMRAAGDDAEASASLRAEARAWAQLALGLAEQTLSEGAIAAASALLARLEEAATAPIAQPGPAPRGQRPQEAAARPRRVAGDYRFAVVVPRPTEPHVEADVLWFPGPVRAPEAVYRLAEQRGHANGSYNLGIALDARDEESEAEAAWRRADAHGHRGGAYNLGVLLRRRDDLAGAEAAFARADQRGDAEAAHNLGMLLYERGDIVAAESAFRRADARGNPRAAGIVAELLRARGDMPGALAAYTRAHERGRLMGDAGVVETCERRIAELNAAAGRDGPDETMSR